MTAAIKQVEQYLEANNLSFKLYQHPAVFTVEEAEKAAAVPGARNKNLFLINKSKDQYYLVCLAASKRLDLKSLANKLQEKKLSFASSKRLNQILSLYPGAVSPFGLINDQEKQTQVIIDQDLLEADLISFHPNENTATLVLKTNDFKRYLQTLELKGLYEFKL
jgi:Ala-tRNA(Pro) deacylase